MTPVAMQALARARAKVVGQSETTQNSGSFQSEKIPHRPGDGLTIAGLPVKVVRGIPDGCAFLVSGSDTSPRQVVQVKQLTKHVVNGPTDHFMFLEGRKHGLALASSLLGMPPAAICENLRRSLASKPTSYALGIQSVIDLIEGAQ